MLIDNIVAVAAIARDNTQLLIFGLRLAIAMMALFRPVIMKMRLAFVCRACISRLSGCRHDL